MLGRQDAENIYVMFSDHSPFLGHHAAHSGAPVPWDLSQLGTAARPSKPEAGWLVISTAWAHAKVLHRRFLLDRDDPPRLSAACLNH